MRRILCLAGQTRQRACTSKHSLLLLPRIVQWRSQMWWQKMQALEPYHGKRMRPTSRWEDVLVKCAGADWTTQAQQATWNGLFDQFRNRAYEPFRVLVPERVWSHQSQSRREPPQQRTRVVAPTIIEWQPQELARDGHRMVPRRAVIGDSRTACAWAVG